VFLVRPRLELMHKLAEVVKSVLDDVAEVGTGTKWVKMVAQLAQHGGTNGTKMTQNGGPRHHRVASKTRGNGLQRGDGHLELN